MHYMHILLWWIYALPFSQYLCMKTHSRYLHSHIEISSTLGLFAPRHDRQPCCFLNGGPCYPGQLHSSRAVRDDLLLCAESEKKNYVKLLHTCFSSTSNRLATKHQQRKCSTVRLMFNIWDSHCLTENVP